MLDPIRASSFWGKSPQQSAKSTYGCKSGLSLGGVRVAGLVTKRSNGSV